MAWEWGHSGSTVISRGYQNHEKSGIYLKNEKGEMHVGCLQHTPGTAEDGGIICLRKSLPHVSSSEAIVVCHP